MKHCKKLLSILLTVMLLLTCVSFTGLSGAQAAETLASGSCGENLTWTLDSNNTLTVSGTGEMYNDNADWYDYSTEIKSVVISDGVTSIGEYMFAYCTALENVTIANTVTAIGEFAFGGCSSLESIHIPAGVTNVGMGAFVACTSLANIAVDAQNAYYIAVDNVLYTKDMTKLVCYPVGKPDVSFSIPETVVDIEGYAFAYNDKITEVYVPDSVVCINYGAFGYCTALENIDFSENSQLILIDDEAFFNCAYLEKIVIPDGVTKIGTAAFAACVSLTDVALPGTVTESVYGFSLDLGESVFSYCGGLESIAIPDSVTSIVYGMFTGCVSLKDVNLPSSLVSIEPQAFMWCSNIETIMVPSDVTSIGDSAFYECYGLTTVQYPGSKAEWDTIVIEENNEYLLNATILFNFDYDEDFNSTNTVFVTDNGDVAGLAGTTAADVLGLVPADATIVDKKGNALTGADKIGTGAVLTLADGTEYVIIVPGDLDGDGEILSNDARSALRNSVGLDALDAPQLKAADVNGDGEITSSDARSALRASVNLDNPMDWLVNF